MVHLSKRILTNNGLGPVNNAVFTQYRSSLQQPENGFQKVTAQRKGAGHQ